MSTNPDIDFLVRVTGDSIALVSGHVPVTGIRPSVCLHRQKGAGPRPDNAISTCVASSFRTPVTATVPIWS
jgi:hypothetical protein